MHWTECFRHNDAVKYKNQTGSDPPIGSPGGNWDDTKNKRSIAGRKGAQTRLENGTQKPLYGSMLSYGFRMLNGSER